MSVGRVVCAGAIAVLVGMFVMDGQEPARAGNQIFRIPPGWIRTETPPSTILSPSTEPKSMVVLLLTGRALTSDFRAMFDQDVRGMNGTYRVVSPGQVQSRHTPQGVDLLATTIELQGPNGTRSWRYYMAASVHGRFEILVYMAATQALFQRHWPAMQQFISTWSFANLNDASTPVDALQGAPPAEALQGAPAEAAPGASSALPAGNTLEGVYGGYKFNYVTVLGVVQRKAVNDYFSFFPNGFVYHGLPESGLAGFNMTRECQREPIFCGTYQVSGDRVVILLNRGTYRQAGVRTPGGLHIEDRDYTQLGDLAKSAARTLDGVFVRADARPGEDLARKFIRFTRDGHFVDQGIVQAITNSQIINGNPFFERPAGAGIYQLSQYTIILRYNDGYQRGLGVTIEPADMDKPVLSHLTVNTYSLVRR